MTSQETMLERLPKALERIGRFLCSEKTRGLNNEFIVDLMSLHACASEVPKMKEEIKRLNLHASYANFD